MESDDQIACWKSRRVGFMFFEVEADVPFPWSTSSSGTFGIVFQA